MSESSSLLHAVKVVIRPNATTNKTKRLKQRTFFISVKVFILFKIRLLIFKIKVYVHRVNAGNCKILHKEIKNRIFFCKNAVAKVPMDGTFKQIADFVYYCFFIIDSLGVIPKYSLYLWRKFFRFLNPIISGTTLTEYLPLSNSSRAFSIRIRYIKYLGASPVSDFHLLKNVVLLMHNSDATSSIVKFS